MSINSEIIATGSMVGAEACRILEFYDQRLQAAEKIASLVEEMCNRIDAVEEDIGTTARPVSDLLQLIGPAVDEWNDVKQTT